jgi:hypothetical protein
MAKQHKATRKDWKARAEQTLRGKPAEELTWASPEGIPIKRLYSEKARQVARIVTPGNVTAAAARTQPAGKG